MDTKNDYGDYWQDDDRVFCTDCGWEGTYDLLVENNDWAPSCRACGSEDWVYKSERE